MLCYLRGEGPRPKRLAMCILTAPPRNSVVEALVDLDAPVPKLLSWKEVRRPRLGIAPPHWEAFLCKAEP